MSKQDNLHDFLTDIADAVREKKGTTEPINAQNLSDEIRSIPTSMWTGHADVEGLKAIGWTDEDIAYYQRHGVDWMEEDDEYHKVSDDNKALYGVLTVDNIQDYKDRIVYLPKIEVGERAQGFLNCKNMVAVPNCFSNLITANNLFRGCNYLGYVAPLDCGNITTFNSAFRDCYALTMVQDLDTKKVSNIEYLFFYAYSLVTISYLNLESATNVNGMFGYCYSLKNVKIKNLKINISLNYSPSLSKESLLYMIENEVAESAITITLHTSAYARLAEDPDIVEALANHPLITIASA